MDLPQHIIHDILSRLPTKDAARASVLSKTWRHAWDTFFNLDFNRQYFQARGIHSLNDPEKVHQLLREKSDELIKYIEHYLERRHNDDLRIHQFRLNIGFHELELVAPRIDRWLRFATSRNTEELYLSTFVRKSNLHYRLPRTVYDAKTLTVLMLKRCELDPSCDIKLYNLQKLWLSHIKFEEHLLQNFMLSCPLIKDLRLKYCEGLKTLWLSSPQLNRVEVKRCDELRRMDIRAPNLQAFRYCGMGPRSMPFEFDLAATETLKELSFNFAHFITDSEFQNLISKFPNLEILDLCKCDMLECMRVSCQKLKKLVVRCCWRLMLADIDTSNLVSLHYLGSEMPFRFIQAPRLRELELCFLPCHANTFWFDKLKEFIGKYKDSRSLNLIIRQEVMINEDSIENVMILEDPSEIMLPPLHEFNDLSITIKSSLSFSNMLEDLFRRHVENLSIVSRFGSQLLKVLCKKVTDRECCRCCWRYLSGFEIVDFEGMEDEMLSHWNALVKSFGKNQCQMNSFQLTWAGYGEDETVKFN